MRSPAPPSRTAALSHERGTLQVFWGLTARPGGGCASAPRFLLPLLPLPPLLPSAGLESSAAGTGAAGGGLSLDLGMALGLGAA